MDSKRYSRQHVYQAPRHSVHMCLSALARSNAVSTCNMSIGGQLASAGAPVNLQLCTCRSSRWVDMVDLCRAMCH